MSEMALTRSYLESLASSELLSLSEKYGIDVPANMSRRLIIAEILEEAQQDAEAEDFTESTFPVPRDILPPSYNETEIAVVVCRPVWVYAYWDISKQDMKRVKGEGRTLTLKVLVLDAEQRVSPEQSFSTPLSPDDRDQYVHLPSGEKTLRVNLCLGDEVLAYSSWVRMYPGVPLFPAVIAGDPLPPLLELSGLREFLHGHFVRHRQSFAFKD